jgi:hypothetical protein
LTQFSCFKTLVYFSYFSIFFFWICNAKWNSCIVPKFGFSRFWLIFQLSFIFNFGEFVQFDGFFFSWISIKFFSQFHSHFWFQVFIENFQFYVKYSRKAVDSYENSNFWFWEFGESFQVLDNIFQKLQLTFWNSFQYC